MKNDRIGGINKMEIISIGDIKYEVIRLYPIYSGASKDIKHRYGEDYDLISKIGDNVHMLCRRIDDAIYDKRHHSEKTRKKISDSMRKSWAKRKREDNDV